MFGLKKTKVEIIIEGDEVHELKKTLLRIHESLNPNMPQELVDAIKRAYFITLQLDHAKAHSLSEEGHILEELCCLLVSGADYIKTAIRNAVVIDFSYDFLYIVRLLNFIVQRALSQELEFIRLLNNIDSTTTGIIENYNTRAA